MPTFIDVEGRAEDVRWMAETGESASGAARRLGLSFKALEKWSRRHAPEAWRRLLLNEPTDHNAIRNRRWGT